MALSAAQGAAEPANQPQLTHIRHGVKRPFDRFGIGHGDDKLGQFIAFKFSNTRRPLCHDNLPCVNSLQSLIYIIMSK